jgi:hypothetical protein
VQALPPVPRVAVANLRRSLIMAIAVGIVATIVLAFDGHLFMGLFLILGLGLGALNTWLVQRSVVNYAASEAGNKKARFTRSVLGRLGLITLLAVAAAFFDRPDGLGVFAGLSVFQLFMLGGASIPLFKQLRQS